MRNSTLLIHEVADRDPSNMLIVYLIMTRLQSIMKATMAHSLPSLLCAALLKLDVMQYE